MTELRHTGAALVLVTAAAAALAVAAPAQAQSNKIVTACTPDSQKLCADVQPGGGRVLQCLVAHREQLSDGCRSALREEYEKRKAAAAK